MRRILLTLMICLVSMTLLAGEVSEQEALEIARQLLQGKSFQQKSLRRAQSPFGKGAFYVFNADNHGGFVVVSADDRTVPVLGYADEGSMDMDNLPSNVRWWLEGIASEIKALRNIQAKTGFRRVCGEAVEPLLTSKWDQDAPYNNQCPKDRYGNETFTGCVATAMAQVMYYYQWPQAAVGALDGYTTYINNIKLDALPGTTFKWDKMRDTYKNGDSDEGADAVAELMRYCGQRVMMDYDKEGSAGSVNVFDMVDYFGFSSTAKNVMRFNYTNEAWEKLIYEEVANKRPVLYSGFSDTGGHEFVIDGYDNMGLFHVNWGWSGAYDGYYSLSVLNPSGRGIGGGTSENGFATNQDAMIGLKKPEAGDVASLPIVYLTLALQNTKTFTRSKASDNFNLGNITGMLTNTWSTSFNIDFEWVLCQYGEVLQVLETKENVKMTPGRWSFVSTSLNLGKDLADGVYELRGRYALTGETPVESCSAFDDIVLLEIKGNQLTMMNASAYADGIAVNSVTVTGDRKEGRPMSAKINWTNNGNLEEQTFFVWLSDVAEAEYDFYNTGYLNRGQTGDVEVVFIPKQTGEITLTIATDQEGKNIVYTEKLTIAESPTHNLKVSVAIAGKSGGYQLAGDSFKASAVIKNNGTKDYDDNLIFELTPIDVDAGGYYSIVGEPVDQLIPVVLAAGEQTTVNVSFSGLVPHQWYMLDLYYYSKTDNGYIVWGADDYCVTGEATAITPPAVLHPCSITYYSVDGKRLDKPEKGLNIIRMSDGTIRKVVVR